MNVGADKIVFVIFSRWPFGWVVYANPTFYEPKPCRVRIAYLLQCLYLVWAWGLVLSWPTDTIYQNPHGLSDIVNGACHVEFLPCQIFDAVMLRVVHIFLPW